MKYNVKANWKLIFLNYCECYHCPVIHPNLAKLSPYRSFNQTDFNPDDGARFWDRVNQQDWQVCELMQAGVSSRVYTPGLYSSAESLLAQFDRDFLRVMGH